MDDPRGGRGDSLPQRPSLVGWFVNNHVAANITMLFLVVGGFIAAGLMITETFPAIDPKTITVATPYPGATPEDIEESITRRVEEALIGIDGVKRVKSSATEGAGIVTVELEDFADGAAVLKDVETEVDRLVDFPPEEAEQPSVVRTKITGAMMSLAVYGDVDEATLHHWAERIESGLLQLPEVTLVNIAGGRSYEIAIEISETTLRHYGLSLEEVARRVAAFSVDLPGGTLRTEAGDILIRVQGKGYVGADFADIRLRSLPDGSSLRLGDIASIRDGFEDSELVNRFQGKSALFVEILRSDSQDTLEMEAAINAYLATLSVPPGVEVEVWRNRTDILRARISLMVRNAILGYVLVFIALLLFLDLKLAFWTSLGIPISFLGGLLAVSYTGISMNMITLFALIVVIGIVVDDAIVVGESIFHEQQNRPRDPFAVLRGVQLVRSPVVIGVLTTIVAFAPLLVSTGVLAQVMRPVPIVVIGILAVSLIEAFLILPAHLSSTARWSRGGLAWVRDRVQSGLGDFVSRRLTPALEAALSWRYVTLAVAVATLLISAAVFNGGIVRFIFFPQIDSDHITVNLKMPTGTPFDVTYRYAEQILRAGEEVATAVDGLGEYETSIVEAVSFTVGSRGADGTGPGASNASSNASNLAQIRMQLVPGDQRMISAGELERRWRQQTPAIPGVESLTYRSSLVRAGDDISLELSHSDEAVLEQAVSGLKTGLEAISGVSEVRDSFEPGKREFVFELTPAGLAAGLTPAQIGRQLRWAYYGSEIHRIQRGRNELKVMVRYPEHERRGLSDLYQARIRLPDGSEMDLRTAAVIREQRGYSEIERVDGRRVVSVFANVEENLTTPDDVLARLQQDVFPELVASYPGLYHGYSGANRDQRADIASLGRNLLVALMVMFVMLASLLRSYVQPLIILSAIPFGFVGSLLGHLLLGFDISFVSLFGMIALSGVVINDSVVLVDYYNHLRQNGYEGGGRDKVRSALVEATTRRFRPILLTTLTTSLGLLPMLLETSLQAKFLIPMAISIAFGILYASVVIVFLVPALILISDDLGRLLRLRRRLATS